MKGLNNISSILKDFEKKTFLLYLNKICTSQVNIIYNTGKK